MENNIFDWHIFGFRRLVPWFLKRDSVDNAGVPTKKQQYNHFVIYHYVGFLNDFFPINAQKTNASLIAINYEPYDILCSSKYKNAFEPHCTQNLSYMGPPNIRIVPEACLHYFYSALEDGIIFLLYRF